LHALTNNGTDTDGQIYGHAYRQIHVDIHTHTLYISTGIYQQINREVERQTKIIYGETDR